MTTCDEIRERFLELLWLADAEDDPALREHLEACEDCAREAASLSAAKGRLDAARPQRPGPETVNAIWNRLEPELDAIDAGKEPAHVLPLRPRRTPWRGWAIGSLAAAAALALVIGLGKRQPEPPFVPRTATDAPGLEARMDAYLDRVEPLILALSNLTPQDAEAGIDLSAERRAAASLAREAALLRREAEKEDRASVKPLIVALEVILVQIANTGDAQDLELVQSILERRAVLFELSLERLRRGSGDRKPKV